LRVEIENTDRELIAKALKGSQLAQYQLYQQYAKAMFNICYRMMNNREEAEDMLQDSFTEVFHKLDLFRHESTFGAWVKQIVVNKCINSIKKRKVDLMLSDEMEKFDLVDENNNVNESEVQYEVEKVRKAMGMLPDGYRVIFSLYSLEGYDHEEIAGIMNISESTSKTQYMRAKNKIKEILNSVTYA
jgi:RNA polymerase sigma-70 factor (ECF subfamily)